MREIMRACRDARARPSVHTRHRVVVASIVPRELCLSSMFAHGGGSVLISGGRSFSQGVLGMGIIVLSENPGVRAQRGPELFRSTIGTCEVRFVLVGA